MKVFVNDQAVETQAATITELLGQLGISPRGVAIANAGKLIPRAQWDTAEVTENASLVVIKAACGG